jgi:glycosyltransferase involved in cell wall biosynthesis
MKILLLTRYGYLGASSRYRTYQFIPYLKENGIEVVDAPLLNDKYLEDLYANIPRNWGRIIESYSKRLLYLIDASKYDLLWIEKELFPGWPAWFEKLLTFWRIPYVVDYDDAIFHNYDIHSNLLVKLCLGRKIDSVMRHATLVIAGNDYLMERAVKAGAKWVEKLPTVIDLQHYSVLPRPCSDVFIIGWIGSPSTALYLQLIQPALAAVCADGRTRVVLVGTGNIELKNVPIEIRSWSNLTEVRDLQSFDVGIMPISDTPWERGKCGLKLIQYMGCGRPVVGSPVGVNKNIIQHEVNGFHASTNEDWVVALTKLRDDFQLRKTMGDLGRAMVEKQYSLQVIVPRLVQLLQSIVGGH